jgi:cyclin-dependent kinase 12/13
MEKRKAKMKLAQEKKEEFQKKILAGRYEIVRVIGKGVSSTVYEGVDRKTTRKVAVKNITRFLENKHESLRILREIILLRVLDHPNIIKLR